jgi:hypothetical protein
VELFGWEFLHVWTDLPRLVAANNVECGRLYTTGLLQASWALTALSSRAIKFKQLPLPTQDPRDRQVCARNQVWGSGSPYYGAPALLTPAIACTGITTEFPMAHKEYIQCDKEIALPFDVPKSLNKF